MKLNQQRSLNTPPISKLKRPNPPTPEMVERAQFVDKTYVWEHARIRSRKQRTPE